MMNEAEFIDKYWSYYLNIENDIINLEKFITFDKDNYNSYSIEFIKMYQIICSEIDVVLKLITNKHKMNEYKEYIIKNDYYINILSSEVCLKSNKLLMLKPFQSLSEDSGLFWWTDYNSVKHKRVINDNYKKANLFNVLNALSALYILESFYYQKTFYSSQKNDSNSLPTPKSNLFLSINNLRDNVITDFSALIIDERDN